jgi:hypothetical protein
MKRISKMLRASLGLVLMGAFLTAMAAAQCGTPTAKLHKQAWRVGDPTALLTQAADPEDPIVGMWHATFTGDTLNGSSVDSFPVDNSLVVWHGDHTEIMNSVRPPQDGNFCMGVWEHTGKLSYKLNHFAWFANDTTNAPSGIGNPQGPTRIIETITLCPDGNHYEGRFTLIATDPSGDTTVTITGSIKGTRITTGTKIKDLL